MHEELAGTSDVLLVLWVLHVAGYRDGSRVGHGRLYDDTFKGLGLGGGCGSHGNKVMRS